MRSPRQWRKRKGRFRQGRSVVAKGKVAARPGGLDTGIGSGKASCFAPGQVAAGPSVFATGQVAAGPSCFAPGQVAAGPSCFCHRTGCCRAVRFCYGTGLRSQKKFLRNPVPAPPDDPTSLSNRTGQNWPWRISVLLSAISHKEPPKKRWGSHALSLDLLVFTCHGWGQRVGRRRVAADIKGNGYRGARGKGCSARTAGVCLSAGCSVDPRELAGRTPFPDRDRRSPPWSRHPLSAAHRQPGQGQCPGRRHRTCLPGVPPQHRPLHLDAHQGL